MADLAKYREVKHVTDHSDVVSNLLTAGWELISAKIVESQCKVFDGSGDGGRIEKHGEAHYILGLPRNHKTPEEKRKSDKVRRMLEDR